MRSSPAPAAAPGWTTRTCHQLRHTCLTRLREAGMALEAVQAQAGHRSIESTRIYLHLTNDWLAAEYRRAADADRRRHRRGRRAARRPGRRRPMSARPTVPQPRRRRQPSASGPQIAAPGTAVADDDAPLPAPGWPRSWRPAASTPPTARCASSPGGCSTDTDVDSVADDQPRRHRGLQGLARRPARARRPTSSANTQRQRLRMLRDVLRADHRVGLGRRAAPQPDHRTATSRPRPNRCPSSSTTATPPS